MSTSADFGVSGTLDQSLGKHRTVIGTEGSGRAGEVRGNSAMGRNRRAASQRGAAHSGRFLIVALGLLLLLSRLSSLQAPRIGW